MPGITIGKFTVEADEDTSPEGRLACWLNAESSAFHLPRRPPEDLPALAASFRADARMLVGAYDAEQRPHAWDARVPVATYGTMAKNLNVGSGTMLSAHLITDVTVRPTHRRRGLLRKLITADLADAAANGFPVAALTVSEATIYGRFGFGCATSTHRIEVDVSAGFRLDAPAAGRTVLAAPEKVIELSETVFSSFHQVRRGSVDRTYPYPRRASGEWGLERPVEDSSVRTAVHYDDDGTATGYVSYAFRGWDTQPATMRIVDLVAVTSSAYLELWRFLGSLDLVQRISWDSAAVDDPLPWALHDRRRYRVTGVDDVLWLRLLDVPAAFSALQYRSDGVLTVRVADQLGLAGGTYRLTVAEGRAEVGVLPSDAVADLELDVSTLASVYLGAASAAGLARAGRIGGPVEASKTLDELLGDRAAPYCISRF